MKREIIEFFDGTKLELATGKGGKIYFVKRIKDVVSHTTRGVDNYTTVVSGYGLSTAISWDDIDFCCCLEKEDFLPNCVIDFQYIDMGSEQQFWGKIGTIRIYDANGKIYSVENFKDTIHQQAVKKGQRIHSGTTEDGIVMEMEVPSDVKEMFGKNIRDIKKIFEENIYEIETSHRKH